MCKVGLSSVCKIEQLNTHSYIICILLYNMFMFCIKYYNMPAGS